MMQGTRLDAVAKAVVEVLDGPRRNSALCRQVVQLLAQGRPVSPLHLAGVLHRTADEVTAELSTHPELEYDANGNIVSVCSPGAPWGRLPIHSSFSYQRIFFRDVRRPEG